MPSIIPGAILPWVSTQFLDLNDAPLAGGKVEFRIAGEATLKDTFNDSDLDPSHANTNPVVLDASGRADIFLEPGGYDCTVSDSTDVELYTREGFEDIGGTWFAQMGQFLATGAFDQTSGYTVTADDNLVTMNSTGGANPCVVTLQPAADRGQLLTVKNMGTIALAVTPDGAETIDEVAGPFTVPAASSPTFPSVLLASDGTSGYYVVSSHGF